LDVQAQGRLVQHQKVRPVQQAAGQVQPLVHTAGELADLPVGVGQQADQVQRLLGGGLHPA
jgi:hypothetical protein